jgi:hypothetical protein
LVRAQAGSSITVTLEQAEKFLQGVVPRTTAPGEQTNSHTARLYDLA